MDREEGDWPERAITLGVASPLPIGAGRRRRGHRPCQHGVLWLRISWLIVARNSDFAAVALSAASLATTRSKGAVARPPAPASRGGWGQARVRGGGSSPSMALKECRASWPDLVVALHRAGLGVVVRLRPRGSCGGERDQRPGLSARWRSGMAMASPSTPAAKRGAGAGSEHRRAAGSRGRPSGDDDSRPTGAPPRTTVDAHLCHRTGGHDVEERRPARPSSMHEVARRRTPSPLLPR